MLLVSKKADMHHDPPFTFIFILRMDSLTHVALGAVIGEAILGKNLGKKALVLGAATQFFPDIDVAASLWLPPANNLLAHRGFTHSFFFISITAFIFSLLANRWHKRQYISMGEWISFFSIQLLVHILLDSFNAYGVGWFEPFNHYRVSFNVFYVADPFFTVPLTIVSIILLLKKSKTRHRFQWAIAALFLSSTYLIYSLINKVSITSEVEKLLNQKSLSHQRYFTTPTPFNTLLWCVVAEGKAGYHVGYRSIFDKEPSIELVYFPRQDSLLSTIDDVNTVQHLKRFSQGYYTIEYRNEELIFNDLRFGQITGWQNPKAPFTFYYYLQHPEDNLMVMQRGRMASWNKESIKSMIKRIKGT